MEPIPETIEKFIILVDFINHASTVGITKHEEKINLNCGLLGIPSRDELIAENNSFIVFPFGRYIVVYIIDLSSRKSKMFCFDYNIEIGKQELILLMQSPVTDSQMEDWLNVQYHLHIHFKNSDDVATLVKS